MLVVAGTELLQSLAHANARVSFGRVFEHLLVSPRYHRLHHAIAAPGAPKGSGTPVHSNFAQLFPVWDRIFGTAKFTLGFEATGVHDQSLQAGHRRYGDGFWEQQWLGLKRLFRCE